MTTGDASRASQRYPSVPAAPPCHCKISQRKLTNHKQKNVGTQPATCGCFAANSSEGRKDGRKYLSLCRCFMTQEEARNKAVQGPAGPYAFAQRLSSQSSGHFVCHFGAQFASHLEHSLDRETLSARWIYLTCLPQPWQALYHHDYQHVVAKADDSSSLLASVKTRHRESGKVLPSKEKVALSGHSPCQMPMDLI